MVNDTSSWAGLATGGTLSLDSGTAQACANACAHLIGGIGQVQGHITDINGVNNLQGFGGLESGEALKAVYIGAADSLRDALNAHVAVLADMGNTFAAAGQLYDATDQSAADWFNNLAGASQAAAAPYPSADQASAPTAGRLMSVSTTSSAAGNNIMAENSNGPYDAVGQQYGVDGSAYAWFHYINVNTDPSFAQAQSAKWAWMSGALQDAASDFDNELSAAYPLWTGNGNAGARSATDAYRPVLEKLAGSIGSVAESLGCTAGWLGVMKQNTPPDAVYPDGPDQAQLYVKGVCMPAFDNSYVTGLHNSAATVPALESPVPSDMQTQPLGSVAPGLTGPAGGGSAPNQAAQPPPPAPPQSDQVVQTGHQAIQPAAATAQVSPSDGFFPRASVGMGSVAGTAETPSAIGSVDISGTPAEPVVSQPIAGL